MCVCVCVCERERERTRGVVFCIFSVLCNVHCRVSLVLGYFSGDLVSLRQTGVRATMNIKVSVLLLAVAIVTVLGQRKRPVTDEWNYRDGSEKVSMRGVANLTQVLDNWRFDILNEMKNLLKNDHQSLLPDYSRIQPLSEALDDLYKEFNALKAHLGDLTEKFGPIETYIDELKAEKNTNTAPAAPIRRKILKKKVPTS
uniref:Uncharacterized protein n=1 Tax=Denticeps clupeoides TaxID=299321 RepID=A0AAY4CTQ7_9TELE